MRTETGYKLPIIGEYQSLKSLIRQLFPTKFATGYVSGGKDAIFSTWWMWMGRCFRVKNINLSSYIDA